MVRKLPGNANFLSYCNQAWNENFWHLRLQVLACPMQLFLNIQKKASFRPYQVNYNILKKKKFNSTLKHPLKSHSTSSLRHHETSRVFSPNLAYLIPNLNRYFLASENHWKKMLTPTWFEHAAFSTGVGRATVAPRSRLELGRLKST